MNSIQREPKIDLRTGRIDTMGVAQVAYFATSFSLVRSDSRLNPNAEVYEDMPELSKEPKDIKVIAPLTPLLRIVVQRGSGPPDYRSIKDPILSGDTLCDLGHRRSAEVIWYVSNGQPESTVPLQVKPVLIWVVGRFRFPQANQARV